MLAEGEKTFRQHRTRFPYHFSTWKKSLLSMQRSTWLKRPIVRVYSIVTFTPCIITSRHDVSRRITLPEMQTGKSSFLRVLSRFNHQHQPLYSRGMILGACTNRRTNKSDSRLNLPLPHCLSFSANRAENIFLAFSHARLQHAPPFLFPCRIPFSLDTKLQRDEDTKSLKRYTSSVTPT